MIQTIERVTRKIEQSFKHLRKNTEAKYIQSNGLSFDIRWALALFLTILIFALCAILGYVPWKINTCLWVALVVSICLHYSNKISCWKKADRTKIHKIGFSFAMLFLCFTPLLMLWTNYSICSLYFQGYAHRFPLLTIIVCVCVAIFTVVVIFKYCYELVQLRKARKNSPYSAFLFGWAIIHLGQLFANINAIMLVVDSNAIFGIDTSECLAMAIDITYYSVMTFLTGSAQAAPISGTAKIMAMTESILFIVFISLVLFGVIEKRTTKDDEDNG